MSPNSALNRFRDPQIQALLNSEEYRNTIFENSHIPVVVMDAASWEFIDCNHAAVIMYGFADKSQTLGKTPVDVSAPLQYDGSPSEERAAFFIDKAKHEGAAVFEWRHRNAHGEIWDAEVHLRSFTINGIELIQFSMIDITERLRIAADLAQAKSEAEENEERFRILHNASFGGIAIHENGRILDCNQGLSDISGYSYEELVGMDGLLLVAESYRDYVKKHIAGRYEKPYHAYGVRKNGEEYPIRLEARELPYKGRHVRAVEFRDISEQRKLEERILQMEKMDAIGQLAGGIAHDFNNMLGGVIGGAELLSLRVPADDQEAKTFLDMILNSAQRAAELSGKLLAFARQNMIHSSPVDVHESIRDAVVILENTIDKRISIHSRLTASSSIVIGDGSQLQSVFLNLGINSSHAMPNGGELLFFSREVDLSEEYCRESIFKLTPGSYIDVEVTDTGCGIQPHNLTKIFEPFFTTKEQGKGTGLGLAAAYGIIQQHNGSITVYSEVDKGTCFHILLPLSATVTRGASSEEATVPGHGTILLVDDEPVMRTVGEQMLTRCGYHVILADSGMTALQAYKDHLGEIDLVILDMIMPQMNGRDCFYEIKKLCPQQRVILASGFSRFDDIDDLNVHGLCGLIHKPFHRTELSRAVHQALISEPRCG